MPNPGGRRHGRERQGGSDRRRSFGRGSQDRDAEAAPNAIGELRRSAAASTFGPGAVADLRTSKGAPVSVIMAGLDEWQDNFPDQERDLVYDPRLQRALGVDAFRLAPVWHSGEGSASRRIPAARFPRWLQCPKCHRIDETANWSTAAGDAGRWCAACTASAEGGSKVHVVPVRFIRACRAGHIDEFPWRNWLTHDANCRGSSILRLIARGTGLARLLLCCDGCAAERSMDAAFDRSGPGRWRCTRWEPWLGVTATECDEAMRAVQRGASNLYFPVSESSLLIPPWDDEIQLRLGHYWPDLLDVPPDERRSWLVTRVGNGRIQPPTGWSPEHFVSSVLERARVYEEPPADLRDGEWHRIAYSNPTTTPSRDFEVRLEVVRRELQPEVALLARVVRLREIRALRGFTRIDPPPSGGDTGPAVIAPISRRAYRWLPAVEVRGEGLVVGLDEAIVASWEARANVVRRFEPLNTAWRAQYLDRYGVEPRRRLTPRFLLVHTLAHVLMRRLSLQCGYSSSALRERLYVGDGMAGALIYTGTTDADGTLGGLQREGQAERAASLLREAIADVRWCSSDPLCSTGAMAAADSLNLAACHACSLAPETSCEEFNQFLDRACLIGTPAAPELGFFSAWV